jgi:hypothetical protein
MKVGVITYIHRNFKGWEFKAISAKVEDDGKTKDVVFGISIENGVTRTGLEIYQGDNYIVGSKDPSRSWRYESDAIPKKWQELSSILEEVHQSTDWSKEVDQITSDLSKITLGVSRKTFM